MSDRTATNRYTEHLIASLSSLSRTREEMERHFDRSMRNEYDKICEAQIKDAAEFIKAGGGYTETEGRIRIQLENGRFLELLKRDIFETIGLEHFLLAFPEEDAAKYMDNAEGNGNIERPPDLSFAHETAVSMGNAPVSNPFLAMAFSYTSFMDQYLKRLDRMQVEISSVRKAKEAVELERDGQIKELERLKKEAKMAQEQKSSIEKELKTAKNDLNSSKNEVTSLSGRIKNKDEYIEKIKDDLSKKGEELKGTKETIGKLNEENNNLKGQKASADNKINNQRERISKLEKDISVLKDRIKSLEEELAAMTGFAYEDVRFNVQNVKKFNQRIRNSENNIDTAGFIDILGLSAINRKYKEDIGNRVIQFTIDELSKMFGDENVFRVRGGQFYVIAENMDSQTLKESLNGIRNRLQDEHEFDIVFGCGSINKNDISKSLEYLRYGAGDMRKKVSGNDPSNVSNSDLPAPAKRDLGSHEPTVSLPVQNTRAIKPFPERENTIREAGNTPVDPEVSDVDIPTEASGMDSEKMIETEDIVDSPESSREKRCIDPPLNPNVNISRLSFDEEDDEDEGIKEEESTMLDLAEVILRKQDGKN